MAKSKRAYKKIHYKRASFGVQNTNLQTIVKELFTHNCLNVGQRKQQIDKTTGRYLFINYYKEDGGMFFGELLHLEEGKSKEFVEIDDNANFYEMSAVATSKLKYSSEAQAKHREFADSILYFGISANHLIVIQSLALRAKHLENHLNWLLKEKTDLSLPVLLQDRPTQETINKLSRYPAKCIRISSPVHADLQPPGPNGCTPEFHLGDNIGSSLFGRLLSKGTVSLDNSLDDANLQVELKIKYRRKTSDSGQQLLDSIATSLRDLDEESVFVDLDGGGTLSGSDLKLNGSVSAVFKDNGTVDVDDLYQKMHNWLKDKLVSAKIESDELEASA